MHLLVLNGSPKGSYSIALQTVNYLPAMHSEHYRPCKKALDNMKK